MPTIEERIESVRQMGRPSNQPYSNPTDGYVDLILDLAEEREKMTATLERTAHLLELIQKAAKEARLIETRAAVAAGAIRTFFDGSPNG